MVVISCTLARKFVVLACAALLLALCACSYGDDDSSSDRSKRTYRPPSASSSETKNPEPKPESKPEPKPESKSEEKSNTYRPADPPAERPKPTNESKTEHVIRTDGSDRSEEPKKSSTVIVNTDAKKDEPKYRPPAADAGKRDEPAKVIVTPDSTTTHRSPEQYRPLEKEASKSEQTINTRKEGNGQYRPPANDAGKTEHRIDTTSGGSQYRPSGGPGRVTHYIRTGSRHNGDRHRSHYYYDYYPYVEVSQVVVETYPEVIYVDRPVYEQSGYYLENARLSPIDQAFADIRAAFLIGRFDLISKYMRDDWEVAVLFDGNYDYTLSGKDYREMTYDALQTMQTTGFVWETVRHRSDGAVTGFAHHTYYEPLAFSQTDAVDSDISVFASFTLRLIEGRVRIVEVGASESLPLGIR